MEINPQEYIDELIKLEPVFKKAGELALKMRETTGSKNKFNTGIAGIDIVTEADLAVQEFILSEMAKTKLVECELIPEEDTPSIAKFQGINGLVLTLDPIDGTIFYASIGRFWSTIVTLHNKKNILYNFCNYPVVDFSVRIANGKVEETGALPKINTKEEKDFSKTIFYTKTKIEKIDPVIQKKLIEQGYNFCKVFDVTNEAGSCTFLFSGKSGGYYTETPNPYDGLVALNYGQAKGFEIFSDLDLSKTISGDHGPHYSGWYVILRK
jgi:fructose-1,6-bisphosphatase/inositol monophosphatase family enzyme